MRTACVDVQPTSGATALPVFNSITQSCNGHATRSPNTIPCDSGPPLCGQRSSSANTSSLAVRKTAISQAAVLMTRDPSRGISSRVPIACQAILRLCCFLAGAHPHRLDRDERPLIRMVGKPGPGVDLHVFLGG